MKIWIFLTLFISANAFAIKINVFQVACNLTELTSEECAGLEDAARQEIEDSLPENSLRDYANGVANATAFSLQGQGSDYADNFENLVIKSSVGIAVQGEYDDLQDNPEQADGLGLGAAITAGFNMRKFGDKKWGPIDFNNLDLFASFMNYDIQQPFGDVSAEGVIRSVGFFGRYHVIKGEEYLKGHLLDWGGIHVHTGIQYAHMDVDANQKFKDNIARSGIFEAGFTNARAELEIVSDTASIPVEISTFFRLGYLFTLYGGFGADFIAGDSNVRVKAQGTVKGGVTVLDDAFEANINENVSRDGDARSASFRAFAGFQFNLPYFRVYLHVNDAIDSSLFGANAGLKFVF